MLTQKTQSWPKSCGAANTLVARIELGDPINLTNENENIIYNQLVIRPGALGAGEILPHSIANHMQANGHNVAIIESPHTTAILLPTIPALAGMYALYNANIGALNRIMREPQTSDLNNNARIFLVVKFAHANDLHYVLARNGDAPNQNQCYIMNPDPGSDEQINLPMTGNYFTTNIGNHFGGGERRYRFLGIAIRAW